MKIELEQNNKVFVFEGSNKWELHPIWLRERVSEKEHLDKNTEQRLFDPSFLKDIKINKVNIIDKLLDIEFSDGVKSKIEIDKIEEEFNPNGSIKNIAGILNKEKNVLGMMPHPERMIDSCLSGEDGSLFFKNLLNNIK